MDGGYTYNGPSSYDVGQSSASASATSSGSAFGSLGGSTAIENSNIDEGDQRFGSGSTFGGAVSSGGSAQVVNSESGFLDFASGGGEASAAKVIRPVIKTGEPVISKSYYLHAAPDDEEVGVDFEEREHIVRPRKHYNIVFIKAPAGVGNSFSSSNVNVFPEVIFEKILNLN